VLSAAMLAMSVAAVPASAEEGSPTASGDVAKTAVQATFSTAVGLHPVSEHQPGVHWKNPFSAGLTPAGAVLWTVGTTVLSTFVGPTIAEGLGNGWLAKALVAAGTSGLSAAPVPGAFVPAAIGGFISSAADSAIDNSGCSAAAKPWLKSAAAGITAGCVSAAVAGSTAPFLPVAGVVAAGTLAINKTQDLIDAFRKPNDVWKKQDQASQPPGSPIGDTGTMSPRNGTGQDLAAGIAKDLALSGQGSPLRDPSTPPRTGQPNWDDTPYPPEPGVIFIPIPGGQPGHPGGGSGMRGPGGHSHAPLTGANMPHSKKPGDTVTPKPIVREITEELWAGTLD
jgi:hypothetical protein